MFIMIDYKKKEKAMRRFNILTSLAAMIIVLLCWQSPASSQTRRPRPSPKASVMQRLGADTDITITYSRPGVKGRKIWGPGNLVPYGMNPGAPPSKGKPFPWRAGANENTIIEFNKDLLIEGQKLAAGKYGIHMLPGEKEWIIIFSKNNSAWGSFSYNPEEDALRVTVKPVVAPMQEWLEYGFDDLTPNSATAYLWWEKVKVPFMIKMAGE